MYNGVREMERKRCFLLSLKLTIVTITFRKIILNSEGYQLDAREMIGYVIIVFIYILAYHL